MDKARLGAFIRRAVREVPAVLPLLSDTARDMVTVKAATLGYPGIREDYWVVIYDSIEGYLTGDRPVTGYRNAVSIAMSEAFNDAVYEGYNQAGGELPLPEDMQAWLSERIGQEREHIISMFDRLKAEWEGIDPVSEALARAEGYARTLDTLYSEAKMRGADNATLVFEGDDGAESCPDCQKMKGKRHTIKYILAHNLIPRPGNDAYECKGYNCEHYWMNPKTGEQYRG